jgi:hypothetical protein
MIQILDLPRTGNLEEQEMNQIQGGITLLLALLGCDGCGSGDEPDDSTWVDKLTCDIIEKNGGDDPTGRCDVYDSGDGSGCFEMPF